MSTKPVMNEETPLPTSSQELLELLDALDIAYEIHHHEPIFTVEEGLHLKAEIPGLHCRNLFLRDKKKKNFLIVAANETAVDLKTLPELIGSGRLSFGSSDRLWQYLGIRPGSVCPFCVVNDGEHQVNVVLDSSMMDAEIVNYHPLDNAQTISLSPTDLLRFFAHTGHEPQVVDLTSDADIST